MKSTYLSTSLLIAGISVLSICRCAAEDITTTDGTVYKNVTVTKADPDALRVSSEEGLARIPFEKLPADIQQKYGYNPEAAAAFQQQESEQRKAAAVRVKAAAARAERERKETPQVSGNSQSATTQSKPAQSSMPTQSLLDARESVIQTTAQKVAEKPFDLAGKVVSFGLSGGEWKQTAADAYTYTIYGGARRVVIKFSAGGEKSVRKFTSPSFYRVGQPTEFEVPVTAIGNSKITGMTGQADYSWKQ